MSKHIIRLRGPWQRTVGSETSSLETHSTESVKLPDDWQTQLGNDFCGSVRYQRHFNCPTGLDATTVVELVFRGSPLLRGVMLGEQPVDVATSSSPPSDSQSDPAPLQKFRFAIHDRLQPRNALWILFSIPAPRNSVPMPQILLDEVQLEIG